MTVPAEPELSAILKLPKAHIQPDEQNLASSTFLNALQRLVSTSIVSFSVWSWGGCFAFLGLFGF